MASFDMHFQVLHAFVFLSYDAIQKEARWSQTYKMQEACCASSYICFHTLTVHLLGFYPAYTTIHTSTLIACFQTGADPALT